MTSPPTFRRASAHDTDALTEIAHASKASWGYPAEWIQRWSEQLTIERGYLASHEVWVATIGEHRCGFYALASDGERLILDHFWVTPPYQGRGVGRRMLAHARARAQARGRTEIYVESDPNAAAFYGRFGARAIGSIDASIAGAARTLPCFVLPAESVIAEETRR